MRADSGNGPDVAEVREITEVDEPPPRPPSPARDIWPWLALLAIAAAAGLVVWLVVLNRGSAPHGTLVPNVVGLRQHQAIGRLTRAGFDVRAVVGPAAAPRGIVATQSPAAGTRQDAGSSVRIRVSNGRRVRTVPTTTTRKTTPTVTTPAVTAQVPDVSGEDAITAAGQVEAAGFVAETDPVTAGGAAGSVVGQDPSAGTAAKAGGVVRISVAVGSSRPGTQVPDVTGRQAAAARAALLGASLTVKTDYRHAGAGSKGKVLSQSPGGGATVPAYTQVALVVGA